MMTRIYDKEQIYDTYYPKVVQYIRSHVGQQQDVEDLAQAVFIKVYGKLELFDPEKSGISTWIYNITRNTVIDHFRTMSHHQHEELSETLKDERGDAAEKVMLEEELEELANALEKLSGAERDLIILHYYKNYTLLDIAEMMHTPYGRIKRLHAKVLLKLKQLIR